MLGLPLAFAAPAVLAALLGLAALYFFLRVTPPRPRQEVFPPLRLLLGLDDKDTTPAKTPWPLLLAAARHRRRGRARDGGADLERGQSARPANRRAADRARRRLAGGADMGSPASRPRAKRCAPPRAAGRLVALAPISQGGAEIAPLDAANFEQRLAALAPGSLRAEPRRRAAADPALPRTPTPRPRSLWIADGLELGGAGAFAAGLEALAAAIRSPSRSTRQTPVAIAGVESLPGALKANLTRADAHAPRDGVVRALDSQGRAIGEAPYDFGAGVDARRRASSCRSNCATKSRALVVGDERPGGRDLADRRALAPPPRRDRLGRQRRRRPAAAVADLLYQARAAALRRNPRGRGRRRPTRSSPCSPKSLRRWCSPT